jgi:hypothetical protein
MGGETPHLFGAEHCVFGAEMLPNVYETSFSG